MIVSATALAQVCADAYADAPSGFDHVWEFAGTHVAHRKLPNAEVVVFRGSLDAVDWMRDAEAIPLWDPRLGFVHGGFMVGLNDALVAVNLLSTPPGALVLTGHSLGGARARLLAALLAYSGTPAAQVTVFGSPRPGFANVRRVLEKSGTELASFRNRNDPVPLVPYAGGLYEHTDQWVPLDAPSPPGNFGPLRDHHIARYQEGLAKL